MATQVQQIVSFGDGAAVVSVEYNDATNAITAVAATVQTGSLSLVLTRTNGQTRTYTVGPGTSRSTKVPPGLQLGLDPESGAVSFSRGNLSASLTWRAS